jgi:hypothetical protein
MTTVPPLRKTSFPSVFLFSFRSFFEFAFYCRCTQKINMGSSFIEHGLDSITNKMQNFYQPASALFILLIVFFLAVRDRKAHLKHIPLLNPSPRFALTSSKSKVSSCCPEQKTHCNPVQRLQADSVAERIPHKQQRIDETS